MLRIGLSYVSVLLRIISVRFCIINLHINLPGVEYNKKHPAAHTAGCLSIAKGQKKFYSMTPQLEFF